jgi:hypothetical protein
MVWLQLVRIGNPGLYEWTEQYLTELAAVRGGAIPSIGFSGRMIPRLRELLAAENIDGNLDLVLFLLGEILPGVVGAQ